LVEYFYDCIRATSGSEIKINAYITDDEEKLITENCDLILYDPTGEVVMAIAPGYFLPEYQITEFILAPLATDGCKGRFWYSIIHEDSNLCFKQPIYLV
jgi:hypothetical protein